MKEDEKNICQQLIAIADEICDKYCRECGRRIKWTEVKE